MPDPGGSSPRVDLLLDRAYDPDPRVRRITQSLARAGYDVRVLAWDRTATLPKREFDGDVLIERSSVVSHGGRGLGQLPYLGRAIASWLPRLIARRADVLHAVDLPMLLVAMAVAPFLGRPRIVYDAFEIYSVMERHKYPRPVLETIAAFERWLPRAADLVLTVGPERQRYFRRRGIESVVVGNWIDRPATIPDREAARDLLGIADDVFTITYAGGLDPSRDIDPLVRFARRHPDDVVLIAGKGSHEEYLRRSAVDVPNVRFLGHVSDPADLFAASDALYYSIAPDHPYASHAAPNNLYSAIAWTLPLIHRGQGEIGWLARQSDIGVRFEDDASLDRAADQLRLAGESARIRASLRDLQSTYRWSKAEANLLGAYPRNGTLIRTPKVSGP